MILDWVVNTLGLYLAVTEKSKIIVTYKTKLYFHAEVHREAVQDWEINF